MGSNTMNHESAEALAIQALAFVAGDETLLPRFLQITGIEASSIREAAAEPGFLAGVLQFIAAHEPTLLQFCEQTETEPTLITAALRALPLGDAQHLTST